MLRTAVLIFGCLVLALGAYLCSKGIAFGGIQTLIGGAIILVGTLFERWRYNNKNASADGDWQPTGERFVDPAGSTDSDAMRVASANQLHDGCAAEKCRDPKLVAAREEDAGCLLDAVQPARLPAITPRVEVHDRDTRRTDL
jgi:hypothetical protein